jgi:hypothetical protein
MVFEFVELKVSFGNRQLGAAIEGIICLRGVLPGTTGGDRPVSTMPTCDHCDAHVSDRFARVFADERGRLLACPSCSANAGIAEVARERALGT